jgi:TolA-binding protein
MDDIRDTRPWFWILFLIVFAVAVVGLIIAISAKNNSVDEKKVVNDATAEIKEELSGLNGALKVADEIQEEQSKVAAQDRARIKRQVAVAVAGTRKRLHKLNKRVASLEGGLSTVEGQNAKTRKSVASLAQSEEELETEVATIKRRLRNLNANGGT